MNVTCTAAFYKDCLPSLRMEFAFSKDVHCCNAKGLFAFSMVVTCTSAFFKDGTRIVAMPKHCWHSLRMEHAYRISVPVL